MTGPLTPNDVLHDAKKLLIPLPEAIFVHQNEIYVSSVHTSCISRIDNDTLTTQFCTGGRPLGCASSVDSIYVADAALGLLEASKIPDSQEYKINILLPAGVDLGNGIRIYYANFLDVGSDGAIYMSDSCDLRPGEVEAGLKTKIWETMVVSVGLRIG